MVSIPVSATQTLVAARASGGSSASMAASAAQESTDLVIVVPFELRMIVAGSELREREGRDPLGADIVVVLVVAVGDQLAAVDGGDAGAVAGQRRTPEQHGRVHAVGRDAAAAVVD